MDQARRTARLATAMGAMTVLLVGTAALAADPTPDPVDDVEDQMIDSSFVKFTVIDGETKVEHPGFDAYHGEDTILEITLGKTKYEFQIFLDRKDEKSPYDVEVSLRRDGKTLIDSSKQKVGEKKAVELSAGKISVKFSIDPHGALDKSRKKKIDGPDGDDPLD